MNFPKFNKDCLQRVVRLKKTVRNRGGETFLEGDLMVVTKRNKSESTVHVRPLKGSIIIDEDDCEFLGDKEAFGFNKYQ